jgi:LuxR family transcriptional regulator, maltose regulon positive regulatory protein
MTAGKDHPEDHPEYHIIRHQVVLLRTVVMRHRGNAAQAIDEIGKLLPAIEELRETLGEAYLHMGLTACYSQLGYAYAAVGEWDKAEESLRRVSPHARECGNIFSLAHATMEWAKISLALGRTEEAEETCRRELALAEQPAYADYPAFCLIQLALADVLRAGNKEAEAEGYLTRGLETAAQSGHQFYLARGHLIAARLRHGRGKIDQARENIQKAEEIAAVLNNRLLSEDIRLTKEGLNTGLAPVQPLIEPLSDRELEVLRLICQGKSNREIAEELFLALDTVKRHANNLYGKLGVGRRTQAVNEARRLGLV